MTLKNRDTGGQKQANAPDVELAAYNAGLSSLRHMMLPMEGATVFSEFSIVGSDPRRIFGHPQHTIELERNRYKTPAGHSVDFFGCDKGAFITFQPFNLKSGKKMPDLDVFFMGEGRRAADAKTFLEKHCKHELFETLTGMVFEKPQGKVTVLKGIDMAEGGGVVSASSAFIVPKTGVGQDVKANLSALAHTSYFRLSTSKEPVELEVLDLGQKKDYAVFEDLVLAYIP